MFSTFMKSIFRRGTIPHLCIIAVVLLANAPYLGHYVSFDPLEHYSNLSNPTKKSLVRGSYTIDPNIGYTSQTLGQQSYMQLSAGQLPWWNHYEQVGAPLAGEMQAASLFPLIGLLHFKDGFLYFHIILQIIAGISTYLLFRRFGMIGSAATLGGVAFALNGTFAWLTNAVFNPIAFLPMLILGIEIVFSKAVEQAKRGWVIIVVAVTLSLYAGFPETAYINALFAAGWVFARLWTVRGNSKVVKSFMIKLFVASVIILLISAPILIAFGTYYLGSNVGPHTAAGHGSGHIPIVGLGALFLPYVYGPIFGYHLQDIAHILEIWWSTVGGYLPITLVPLAIYSLFDRKNRPIKIFLLVWIILTVGRSYGLPLLTNIINIIPAVKLSAFYRYCQPSFEFALIILSMMGLSDLIVSKSTQYRKIAISILSSGIVLVGSIIVSTYYLHRIQNAPHLLKWTIVSYLVASSLLGLVCAVMLINKRYIRVSAIVLSVSIEVIIGFMAPLLSAPRKVTTDYRPIEFLQHNLGNNRFYTFGPISPNYGSSFNIASINTNNLPISRDWSDYVQTNLDKNVDPLVFTGQNRLDPAGPSAVDEFLANLHNYENVGVKYVLAIPFSSESIKLRAAGLQEVQETPGAAIYQLSQPAAYFDTGASNCDANIVSLDEVIFNCSKAAHVIRRELYFPGWTVKSGHKAISIKKTDRLFQDIAIPQGATKLTFYFEPPYIKYGYVAYVLGVLLLILALLPPRIFRGKD